MIAIAKRSASARSSQDDDHPFVKMLPSIRRQADVAFREATPELREELVAECIANAYVAYVALLKRGKEDLAYATPLAQYAIRQIRVGRRVGCKMNVCDLTSQYGLQRRGVSVERLDRFDREELAWHEVLVEDRRVGPAEIAASRIDFSNWLRTLTKRQRKIATTLATGESTTAVARRFRVSLSRISQFRRELEATWEAFTSDRPVPATA